MNKNTKLFLVILLIMSFIVDVAVVAFFIGRNGLEVNNDKQIELPDEAGTEPDFYENGIVVDGNGNVMKAGTVYAMPSNITFYTAKSGSSSVKVKATITPHNADDKSVTWTSDAPDIVSVAPSPDDPLTATITKLRTLVDGRVTITCRSVDNPSKYAECIIDQLIGSDVLELVGSINGNPSELVFGNSYTVSAYWNDITPGVGTIKGDTDNVRWSLNLTYAFMQKVDEHLAGTGYTLTGEDGCFDTTGVTGTLFATPYGFYMGPPCDSETFNHAFKLAMKETDVHATLTIHADYTYKGRIYHSGSVDIPVKFSLSGIWIGVDGVEIDQDNVLFT